MAVLGASAALLCVGAAALDPLRVAVLSHHHPKAWSNASCTEDSRGRVACNLKLYETAIEAAAQENVSLLVMPEGYGLSVTHAASDFYEPFISSPGEVPAAATAASSPQQYSLAAAAARNRVAVVANIFVELANGTRRIADVVYSPNGTCLATYFKHHLFPTELTAFTAGPFDPTTFALGGRTFGLVICYEGIYPDVTGDWSQMEALKKQGADAFLWSVGGEIPLGIAGGHMARKFNVAVIASEDRDAGAVLGTDGKAPSEQRDVLFAVPGYTEEKLAIRVSSLPLP
jgi:hypothetical protein